MSAEGNLYQCLTTWFTSLPGNPDLTLNLSICDVLWISLCFVDNATWNSFWRTPKSCVANCEANQASRVTTVLLLPKIPFQIALSRQKYGTGHNSGCFSSQFVVEELGNNSLKVLELWGKIKITSISSDTVDSSSGNSCLFFWLWPVTQLSSHVIDLA